VIPLLKLRKILGKMSKELNPDLSWGGKRLHSAGCRFLIRCLEQDSVDFPELGNEICSYKIIDGDKL